MTRVCQFCGISGKDAANQGESICNRDGLVGPHSFMDMPVYDQIAKVYGDTYGEPLVADWRYVEPLLSQVEMAVACQHDLTSEAFVAGSMQDEIVARTAAVIAVIAHGTKAVK